MNTPTSQSTTMPTLPRSAPEARGISSQAIQNFITAADQQVKDMHSFMLVRHGHVVAEGWWRPYAPESPHVMFSLSKSFTSTAVGLAIAEGLLSVDDEVLKFFPAEAPPDPAEKLKAMRVRDLLCMATGHEKEPSLASQQEPWTQAFLAWPVPHKPGTHFLYNSPATYMQSAIVQKVTGQTVLDYLRPRLFEPLGIENPTWGTSPEGVSLGGWGLNIRTEDIARFGQLYLQKGQWQGQQLVPAAWVDAATARQVSNGSNPHSDWEQGYGYQFWRCRHGAYRGDGMYGQFCVILPEQDAVVAITAGTSDLQGVLNLVWDHLFPAMQPGSLPDNEQAGSHLQETLASPTLPHPEGSATPSGAASWMGQEFHFPANEQQLDSIKLETNSHNSTTTLVLRINGNEQRIPCGYHAWEKSRLTYGSFTDQPVAASGAWTGEGAYTARLCLYETATSLMVTLRPAGETIVFEVAYHPGGGTAHKISGHPQ